MKKIVCLFMTVLVILTASSVSFAQKESAWEVEYAKVIDEVELAGNMQFVLTDTDYDEVPELFSVSSGVISMYTYKNSSLMKVAEIKDVPPEFLYNMKAMYNTKTDFTDFLGQAVLNGKAVTYKLFFSDKGFIAEVIYDADETGFFDDYILRPHTVCILTKNEIRSVPEKAVAAKSFFERYSFLESLSDDTADFSNTEREKIKKIVGKGAFLSFDKISNLGASNIFVQYYVEDISSKTYLPYKKVFACISLVDKTYEPLFYYHESEINTEFLRTIKSSEHEASNIYIDYNKAESFRGFDDFVNYLSAIISESGKIANDNGKKDISEYIEFAVNKSARAQIKAKNNVATINEAGVSFIAEYAVDCMQRLDTVCSSGNFSKIRKPRVIPQIVLTNVDLKKPVRIEFESGTAQSISAVSGIRLMLDDSFGVYITCADLSALEKSADCFCIEITKKENVLSVVFTDKSNKVREKIDAPVWFVLPAESRYSTIIASYSEGTENLGGQYHDQQRTIEFSTKFSGDFEVLKNDITINDIENLPENTQDSIRFLVSKGIFTVDKRNRFNPNGQISKYEFTESLVKMFYDIEEDAVSSFTDVTEKNKYYDLVASAEKNNVAVSENERFYGNKAVLREYVVALLGRTLMQKSGYEYPENPQEFLVFADSDKISEWAKTDIALAVERNLVEKTEKFLPNEKMTREKCATLLYKTYIELHEVSPVTTASAQQSEEVPVEDVNIYDKEFVAAMSIFGFLFLLFVGYIIRKIIKKARKKSK